ncbi:MAG: DUF1080 domain-containing protein [Cyclobacteriaceae bacterium]
MIKICINVILFFFVLLFYYSAIGQSSNIKEEWTSLFNGRDLDGWNVKITGNEINVDPNSIFLVEDGILKVYDHKKDKDVQIGHMFYNKAFSYYRLKFEYRFTGKQIREPFWDTQYGGVVFHAQSPQSMGVKQGYPVCLEFQLLGGLGTGERSTGNVCTIGTVVEKEGEINPAHCIDSNSKTFDGNRWISAEIVVLGDSLVTHIIEGDIVLEFEKPRIGGGFVNEEFDWAKGHVENSEEWIQKEGTLLNTGLIGIQAHDPMEFRKVELLNLVGCKNITCENYKPYYVHKGECSCS